MSVILLADESPHAQRMGRRILTDEGFQVVCTGDGKAAALSLPQVNPDVIVADAYLPGLSGIELCRYAKAMCPHGRVILTVGLLKELDEAAARRAGCDAILRKPFEASVVLETVRPLLAAAREARNRAAAGDARKTTATATARPAGANREAGGTLPARASGLNGSTAYGAAEEIRTAVQKAVARELPRLLDELTRKVLIELGR